MSDIVLEDEVFTVIVGNDVFELMSEDVVHLLEGRLLCCRMVHSLCPMWVVWSASFGRHPLCCANVVVIKVVE